MYYNTLRILGLTKNQLQPSATTLHRIIPGKSAQPTGQIPLIVTFGNSKNFHSKFLNFEVVKIQSPYHAIFGRTTYTKFMVRPYYTYLKLKMIGPHGMITIQGSFHIAMTYERNASNAEATYAKDHQQMQRTQDSSPTPRKTQSTTQ